MTVFTRRTLALAAATTLVAAWAPTTALADSAWPEKIVTFITPYPPGGSSDVITRFLADRVSKQMGKTVIVENKPGAGATLGTEFAARAKPDGYTFFVTPMATITVAPWLRQVRYSVADFTPVAKLSSSYGLISTYNEAPFSNYKEFAEAARKKPGEYTFATNGVGSVVHLTAVVAQKEAGIDVLHVPYKGAAESMSDLMGQRIDIMYDPVTAAQVAKGTLKGLATTGAVRNPALPDIPTLQEQGINLPYSGTWFGIFAPAGTPSEIVDKMAEQVRQALDGEEVKKQLQVSAMYPDFEGPEEFAKTVKSDADVMRGVIEREGIKLD